MEGKIYTSRNARRPRGYVGTRRSVLAAQESVNKLVIPVGVVLTLALLGAIILVGSLLH